MTKSESNANLYLEVATSEIEEYLSQIDESRKIINRKLKSLSRAKREDTKNRLTDEIAKATEKYDEALNKFIESGPKTNRTLKQTIDNNTRLKNFDSEKIDYRNARYAWKRNIEQTALLRKNGDISVYDTTGSWGDSLAKTLFNKAGGLRQQSGLSGLLANVGYQKSGVGLALGLGKFGQIVEYAGKCVKKFAEESVAAYGEIQSIKTNLGIVYSSQSQADSTFNQIAEYSVKSPFGVQTVSEYAVLLKQSGIYASDLMDTLKQIGDVAGGNQQKFANIANSFSQIEANGKATTRQLRQFATAGIPIYKELTKAYEQINGKTVSIDQVRKLTESGKITADVIEKAFLI